MANWSGFFKIVEPTQETEDVSNNVGYDNEYANYSWYNQVIQGSSNRLVSYRQFDQMDNDLDISNGLDTLAEEMTGNNAKNHEPLDINIESSGMYDIPTDTVLTLRTALQYWNDIHDWDNRLFNISRTMLKYGDCFFLKSDDNKRWEYIHPRRVLGAIVKKDSPDIIVGWQIEANQQTATLYTKGKTNNVPAKDVVRFTLNDDMSETHPFGASVLGTVYKTHKQKEMLEDAILIYRVQRAPERRVFHVDVGKMQGARVKAYLEQVKNEIKQKNIPTMNGGQSEVDSIYNPQSMQEDMFFANRGEGKGSRVEILPGGSNLGETSDLDYFVAKNNRGLKIPSSYTGDSDSAFNDGKVGVAYIQELRFYKYITRLQGNIERVIDVEFKKFLKQTSVNINEMWYNIKMPESANFGAYRQQEIDGSLLQSYNQADGISHLSKRFSLKRYLQLSDDDILENERLLREEKGLPMEKLPSDASVIYGDKDVDDMDMDNDTGSDVSDVSE